MSGRCHAWMFVLLLLLLPSVAQASSSGRFLYGVTNDDVLYTVDAVTGATLNTVTMTLAGYTINGGAGMAVNPADGKLYVLLQVSGSTPRMLATVDPTTGVATAIGFADDGSGTLTLADMTFTSNGTLYAVSGTQGSNALSLLTVSTTTGAATLVVALTNGQYGEVIVFNPTDGLLYHGAYDSPMVFETIDPANPLNPPVSIGLSGNVPGEPNAMTYWNGFFIWATFGDLYLVRTDGVAELISTTAMSYPRGLALGGTAPTCPQTLYGAAHQGPNAPDIFFAIDPATGAAAAIGPVGFERIGGMDFDSTGTLYATGERMDGSNVQVLLKIDACTGKGTEIGATGGGTIQDISVNPATDVIFAMDGPNGNLETLDKATGLATVVGSTGAPFNAGLGITFDLTGANLYFGDTADLYSLDPLAGTGTFLMTMTFPPPGVANDRFAAMDTNPFSGVIYGAELSGYPASAAYLSTLDPTTGNVTIIGQTQLGVDSLAFGSGLGYTTFNLTVTLTGASGGTGSVASGDGKINCGATCQATYNLNAAVTLTATPAAGSVFTGWSGACTGTGACNVTMSKAQAVTAQFSGAPPDFQLGPAPGGQTVNAGQSAHYNISINGGPTFTGVVTFACTAGLPKGAVCSFNPTTVTPGPNGVASTALTISTSARQIFSMDRAPLRPRSGPIYASLLPVVGIVFAGLGTARKRRLGKRTALSLVFLALLLLSSAVLLGCGSIPVNPSVTNVNGTPAGSNAVTVTATSGSLSHSLSLNLTVN